MREHERQVSKYRDWVRGEPTNSQSRETKSRQAHILNTVLRYEDIKVQPNGYLDYLKSIALKVDIEVDLNDDEEEIAETE